MDSDTRIAFLLAVVATAVAVAIGAWLGTRKARRAMPDALAAPLGGGW